MHRMGDSERKDPNSIYFNNQFRGFSEI
jgi:hypothetical protein